MSVAKPLLIGLSVKAWWRAPCKSLVELPSCVVLRRDRSINASRAGPPRRVQPRPWPRPWSRSQAWPTGWENLKYMIS